MAISRGLNNGLQATRRACLDGVEDHYQKYWHVHSLWPSKNKSRLSWCSPSIWYQHGEFISWMKVKWFFFSFHHIATLQSWFGIVLAKFSWEILSDFCCSGRNTEMFIEAIWLLWAGVRYVGNWHVPYFSHWLPKKSIKFVQLDLAMQFYVKITKTWWSKK